MNSMEQRYPNALGYYIHFIIKAGNNTEGNDGETIDIKTLLVIGQADNNSLLRLSRANCLKLRRKGEDLGVERRQYRRLNSRLPPVRAGKNSSTNEDDSDS
ncbi:hypothetical protein C922_05576 [Plasmodium inui San Antonio 1]|uniref:Uncharacterized protein n=1 Tax=Plasmodium inui San Antonio 1 TaxID=1237626 RepID=W6ZXS0_9APIC|nr:hypothetical protein C922_05576 [Plasmodium inui San Antonio 1]EUD64040.1 hypothetical protein C922_05576 [Plasmodium inui San Antonio 1]